MVTGETAFLVVPATYYYILFIIFILTQTRKKGRAIRIAIALFHVIGLAIGLIVGHPFVEYDYDLANFTNISILVSTLILALYIFFFVSSFKKATPIKPVDTTGLSTSSTGSDNTGLNGWLLVYGWLLIIVIGIIAFSLTTLVCEMVLRFVYS
jgi:hypothetical protein